MIRALSSISSRWSCGIHLCVSTCMASAGVAGDLGTAPGVTGMWVTSTTFWGLLHVQGLGSTDRILVDEEAGGWSPWCPAPMAQEFQWSGSWSPIQAAWPVLPGFLGTWAELAARLGSQVSPSLSQALLSLHVLPTRLQMHRSEELSRDLMCWVEASLLSYGCFMIIYWRGKKQIISFHSDAGHR